MFTWNDPYVLAILLGFFAVGLFYFDQKQKKETPSNMSYVKVFTLVTGLIFSYNYFVDNNILPTLTSTSTSPSTSVISEVTNKVLKIVSPSSLTKLKDAASLISL